MYYVSDSKIHGRGLFAARKIKKGELLGHLDAVPTKKDGPHTLWIDDDTAVKVRCDLRYINHSSKPNAVYYDDLTVVALRDIAKDEEITHCYGEGWEPKQFK